MHKSEKELKEELDAAAKLVLVGGLYVHYKDSSHCYRVRDLAMGEDDFGNEVPWVVYKAKYGLGIVYSRLLSEWLKPAEWKGETVERYSRVESLQLELGEDHPE